MYFKKVLASLACVVLYLSATTSALAADFTIKIAHESPETHPVGAFSLAFKAEIEKRTGGRVEVQVFPQGQLYKSPRAATEAAISGVIQMSIPSTGYMATVIPAFEIVDLPMLFKNEAALYAFEDGPIGKELLGMLEAKGLKGLGWVSNVPLDLFATQSIVTVNQFAGKKIRAHSAMLERTVKALGGNPISMPAAEMFLSLQRGVIDGAFTTVEYAAPNKYNEVAKHVTRAAVSAIAYPIVIQRDFWNRLSPDLQNAMSAAAAAAIAANRTGIAASAEKAVATLRAGGAQVIELTPQQRGEWQEKLQPIYEDARKRLGAGLVDRAIAASK